MTIDHSASALSNKKERSVYIDFMRIIAILFVMFNHTQTKGYTLFTVARTSPMFGLYLFSSVLCRIAIYVFFMISGALLLKKDEPISFILGHRFAKYLFTLIAASFANYLINSGFANISLTDFAVRVYSTTIATALWYLWAYLGLILALPFLRKISRMMRFTDFIYLIGIKLLFSGINIFDFFASEYSVRLHSSFSVFVTANIFFYPLMGDFIANKIKDEELTRERVLTVVAIGIAALIVECWLTCVWCEFKGEWKESSCQNFFDVLVYLPACAFFVAMKYLFSKIHISKRIRKLIVHVGSCTFGVFLFETIWRSKTMFLFSYLDRFMPSYLACCIWLLFAFAVGVIATTIFKRIPILRRFI